MAFPCGGRVRSRVFIRRARSWRGDVGRGGGGGGGGGADGAQSRVRHWARLDARERKNVRFAFRRHYQIAPWTDFMELHWGARCQLYVTAVGAAEICVAMISDSAKLRVEEALGEFRELSDRLQGAEYASSERGSITVSRRLRQVYRGSIVTVGDASGGVDAITGE